MKVLRKLMILAALLVSVASFAQPSADGKVLTWKTSVVSKSDDILQVVFTGKIAKGYHTYTITDKFSATEISDPEFIGCEPSGALYMLCKPVQEKDEFGETVEYIYDEISIAQDVKMIEKSGSFKGTVFTNSCTSGTCKAEYFDFNITLPDAATTRAKAPKATVAPKKDEVLEATTTPKATVAPEKDEALEATTTPEATVAPEKDETGSLWALIFEAILWGFAMLLTPCVFPMVPMTVSFFMKGSASVAQGRMKALLYGFFIVMLYTLPISIIIMITKVVGGDAVTADIFNWLATHWLPNLVFFVVFMIFAASFFGAFEITLPENLVNKSDKGADKGGILGIFFMALTLVLVSFSCTGPIVGTVLIKSTQGEFWTPMVTMLAFSIAFALPFTVLALFPSLLKKFKKSGGSWLNSVKVVLGFIEIALGFKFLSVADQTYHWGLLDREVYLAIWIVVFTLLGLYLLGKIRFSNDEPVEHLTVPRLALSVGVLAFVVYMIPGMFGAPLKALSGYLPPITTQDFVLGQGGTANIAAGDSDSMGNRYGLHLPLGIQGYFSLEEGLAAAKKEGKPVFVDITGHGCVNCREMESRVWSDPAVLNMLKNDFVVVALYTDDKSKLEERDWVTADNGEVYKQLGRANSYIARTRFNSNAQPNYVLLSPEGEQLAPLRGYDLNIPGFIEFLQSGINAMK